MEQKNFDVVTFGETMVLFNPESNGSLRYIHSFSKSIAGAESNVAIALAKLGRKVGWFSKLGDDEFGRYIESFIRGEGVDVSKVILDNKNTTGILFKERFGHVNSNVYYYRKHSAASYMNANEIDYEYIKKAKVLHITGITLAISKDARNAVMKAVEYAKNNGVLVSFDPNIRLKLWSIEEAKETMLKVCEKADIIFPGIDEGEMLLGLSKPEAIIEKFHNMGAHIVVLKLGKEGCIVSKDNYQQYVKGYKVEKMEDSVGAGDGFAAGFLCGYFEGLPMIECGEYGNGVGAMATLVKGDIEGLPTRDQLLMFINKKNHIDR